MILGVLLAAGASRRFGPEDKLLSDWKGQSLISHAASALNLAGCDAILAVTSSEAVARALPPAFLHCPVAPGQPMSASWEAAVRMGQRLGADQLLFALGDMPNIRAETLQRLAALARAGIGAGCALNGRPLPPASFSLSSCLAVLPLSPGDQGARPLLSALPRARLIDLSPVEAFDLDLPRRGDGGRVDPPGSD